MPKTATLLTVAACAVAIAFATNADERDNPLLQSLGETEYQACGLEQLTAEQSERLFDHFRARSSRSFLGESAHRYMESNGWRQIEVLGVRESGEGIFTERLLIIADGYEILPLDPWTDDDNLPLPGLYWAKSSLSSWEILMPDGKDSDFNAVDKD